MADPTHDQDHDQAESTPTKVVAAKAEQVHRARRPMRTPTLNRQRVALLRDVEAGKIYRSMGGCDLRMVRAGQNQRVDRKLRELTEAGWVELGPDGRFHALTDAGVMALGAES